MGVGVHGLQTRSRRCGKPSPPLEYQEFSYLNRARSGAGLDATRSKWPTEPPKQGRPRKGLIARSTTYSAARQERALLRARFKRPVNACRGTSFHPPGWAGRAMAVEQSWLGGGGALQIRTRGTVDRAIAQ